MSCIAWILVVFSVCCVDPTQEQITDTKQAAVTTLSLGLDLLNMNFSRDLLNEFIDCKCQNSEIDCQDKALNAVLAESRGGRNIGSPTDTQKSSDLGEKNIIQYAWYYVKKAWKTLKEAITIKTTISQKSVGKSADDNVTDTASGSNITMVMNRTCQLFDSRPYNSCYLKDKMVFSETQYLEFKIDRDKVNVFMCSNETMFDSTTISKTTDSDMTHEATQTTGAFQQENTNKTAVIVGAVIGTVAITVIVVVVTLVMMRRRRQQKTVALTLEEKDANTVDRIPAITGSQNRKNPEHMPNLTFEQTDDPSTFVFDEYSNPDGHEIICSNDSLYYAASATRHNGGPATADTQGGFYSDAQHSHVTSASPAPDNTYARLHEQEREVWNTYDDLLPSGEKSEPQASQLKKETPAKCGTKLESSATAQDVSQGVTNFQGRQDGSVHMDEPSQDVSAVYAIVVKDVKP